MIVGRLCETAKGIGRRLQKMRANNCRQRAHSSSVRKSIVPNSRAIAGGPQIFAPIAKYARNKFDDAVTVAGIVDPGGSKIENNESNLVWFQRCTSFNQHYWHAGIADAGYNI